MSLDCATANHPHEEASQAELEHVPATLSIAIKHDSSRSSLSRPSMTIFWRQHEI
jgi:hypothetical protein